jgi:hypothetical protein
MFWPFVLLSQSFCLSAPTTDVPVYILQIIMTAKALEVLENLSTQDKNITGQWLFIIMLGLAGVCIKLSMMVFSGTIIFIIFLSIHRTTPALSLTVRKKTLMIFLIVVAAGLVPCMIRNVIVSGYLFYPVTLTRLGVDWSIPATQAIRDASDAIGWARMPGADFRLALSGHAWIMPWFMRHLSTPLWLVFPLAVSMGAGLLFLTGRIAFRQRHVPPALALSVFPVVAALLAWFLAAPDIRFAGALFWLLAVITTMGALFAWSKDTADLKSLYVLLTFSALFYLSFTAIRHTLKPALEMERAARTTGTVMAARLMISPAGNSLVADVPKPTLVERSLASGLKVYTPVNSELCFDQIPCSPLINEKLCQRKPGDPSSGYFIKNIK